MVARVAAPAPSTPPRFSGPPLAGPTRGAWPPTPARRSMSAATAAPPTPACSPCRSAVARDRDRRTRDRRSHSETRGTPGTSRSPAAASTPISEKTTLSRPGQGRLRSAGREVRHHPFGPEARRRRPSGPDLSGHARCQRVVAGIDTATSRSTPTTTAPTTRSASTRPTAPPGRSTARRPATTRSSPRRVSSGTVQLFASKGSGAPANTIVKFDDAGGAGAATSARRPRSPRPPRATPSAASRSRRPAGTRARSPARPRPPR